MSNSGKGDDLTLTAVEKTISESDILQQCQTYFDEVVLPAGGVTDFLNATYSTPEKRALFAAEVDKAFPIQVPKKTFASDWKPGRKLLRPWMLNWSADAGNHGMRSLESQRKLLMLVLAGSFKTGPELHVETTLLAIPQPDPKLLGENRSPCGGERIAECHGSELCERVGMC